MYENLSDLDALAAGSQGILKSLSAADDADAAELLGKVHAHIGPASGSDDPFLCERQMTKASLHHLKARQGSIILDLHASVK